MPAGAIEASGEPGRKPVLHNFQCQLVRLRLVWSRPDTISADSFQCQLVRLRRGTPDGARTGRAAFNASWCD